MKFELKKWNIEYIGDVAKYANNEKIARNLRNVFPFPYTYEDAEWYVKNCIEKGDINQLCRVIVVEGEAVGSIGINVRDDVYCKTAEVGYWLGEPFWNYGIMSEAVSQLCEEAFKTFDIVRIFAEPFAYNIGSRRTLEKAGFVLESIMRKSVYKCGEIYDSCMYALIKETRNDV